MLTRMGFSLGYVFLGPSGRIPNLRRQLLSVSLNQAFFNSLLGYHEARPPSALAITDYRLPIRGIGEPPTVYQLVYPPSMTKLLPVK
jgi:hypothetical protein